MSKSQKNLQSLKRQSLVSGPEKRIEKKCARLEKHFQRKVNNDLKKLPNTWAFHPSDRAKKGIPDDILCVNGHFVAFENKRSAAEKLTPLQKHTLKEIADAGGIIFEANPENWGEIFEQLKELAK